MMRSMKPRNVDAHRMSGLSDGTTCGADHGVRRNVREREVEWSALMHLANAGDGAAYSRLLQEMMPILRAPAERELGRAGLPAVQREAIVQEILLAVHLKRHTRGKNSSFCTWLLAIARNKLLSALHQNGHRNGGDIDNFADPSLGQPAASVEATHLERHIRSLPHRQRLVLQTIFSECVSVRETAAKLMMSEKAVRVALHRGLSGVADRMGGADASRFS